MGKSGTTQPVYFSYAIGVGDIQSTCEVWPSATAFRVPLHAHHIVRTYGHKTLHFKEAFFGLYIL